MKVAGRKTEALFSRGSSRLQYPQGPVEAPLDRLKPKHVCFQEEALIAILWEEFNHHPYHHLQGASKLLKWEPKHPPGFNSAVRFFSNSRFHVEPYLPRTDRPRPPGVGLDRCMGRCASSRETRLKKGERDTGSISLPAPLPFALFSLRPGLEIPD
ncbi:hypothetical protein JRQ81_000905 [Phrynocephalus forsythii]|uniref:Uncharacterized protein n=1 Tax=Phrynocephalus forsythii TaxID=171643 RepID=A0A9Q1B8D0_9SAUR|nr:hypothetical protein JRQ81_000905 [Phrynocephalus forsythii]